MSTTNYSNNPANDHRNDDKKVFVGGLGLSTREDLMEYFQKFGNVVDVSLKTDFQTGVSRGFGFVMFDNETAPVDVLKCPHHTLKNGRRIEAKSAKIRPGREPELKIFVGGLNPETSEETVQHHFEKYGKIVDLTFPKDKLRNVRKGFCFITFEKEESTEKAVVWAKQEIGGKKCDVTKALAPEKKEAMRSAKAAQSYYPSWAPPQSWNPSYGQPPQQWGQNVAYPPQPAYNGQSTVNYHNQPVYPPQNGYTAPQAGYPAQPAYSQNAYPAAYPPAQASGYVQSPAPANPPHQGPPRPQGPPQAQVPPQAHAPPQAQAPQAHGPPHGHPPANGHPIQSHPPAYVQPPSQVPISSVANGNNFGNPAVSTPQAYDYSQYNYGYGAPAEAAPPSVDYAYAQQPSQGKAPSSQSQHYHPYQRSTSTF